MSVHHCRCIALCSVNINQKGRFWASSLASGQVHAKWGQIIANVSNRGAAWPPWGSSPVVRRLHKQNSIGVSQLIHLSDMSKQRESIKIFAWENCSVCATMRHWLCDEWFIMPCAAGSVEKLSKHDTPLDCCNFTILNEFWWFWQKCYRDSKQSDNIYFPTSRSNASALPVKTHHIFSLQCCITALPALSSCRCLNLWILMTCNS